MSTVARTKATYYLNKTVNMVTKCPAGEGIDRPGKLLAKGMIRVSRSGASGPDDSSSMRYESKPVMLKSSDRVNAAPSAN